MVEQTQAGSLETEALARCDRPEAKALTIAVRVYPKPSPIEKHARSQRSWRCPNAMLMFDTETRTDATQRLTFGSYRFIESGQCLEEGLFYADDLPRKELKVLERYAANHPELRLLTRPEFLQTLYSAAYKGRCLLVGFNLPFDLSRLAHDAVPARGR